MQRPEYLKLLREITRKNDALLIFDEVISGFCVARGGVAQLSRITPDLATFGKIIGGGMPVGGFGGRREIMSRLAPDGDTYQAGTLSGNPVAMSAGVAALDVLIRESGWEKLEALGATLERMLQPVIAKAKFPIRFVRAGSLFWLALHDGPVPRAAITLSELEQERFASIFHAMLARNVYLPPSAYEVCFLSLAHSTADLEQFVSALDESLDLTAKRVK
jgi:glutamate-1-semialdehyde 2,1-aminomutase